MIHKLLCLFGFHRLDRRFGIGFYPNGAVGQIIGIEMKCKHCHKPYQRRVR